MRLSNPFQNCGDVSVHGELCRTTNEESALRRAQGERIRKRIYERMHLVYQSTKVCKHLGICGSKITEYECP